ncbi:MAG: ABC transporter substrate-binding protein, partial [Actinomycetia bacterium]|nr:ABC transporter substrate-binding protein [Actinomycetes bacterium]
IGFILIQCSSIAFSEERVLTFSRIQTNPDQVVAGEIIKVAYKRLGITAIVKGMPGKRALIQSSEGFVDGETIRLSGIEKIYPTLIRVPTPINFIEGAVFSKKYQFKISGWSSIKDYKIGLVRGVKFSEAGTKGFPRIQIAPSIESLMQMIDLGRVDVGVVARLNGILTLKKLKINTVSVLEPPLNRIDTYHYLH